jgi:hypothetical protein
VGKTDETLWEVSEIIRLCDYSTVEKNSALISLHNLGRRFALNMRDAGRTKTKKARIWQSREENLCPGRSFLADNSLLPLR